jgi:long-subunit acyl-CoA synthetase (AMP-forming)
MGESERILESLLSFRTCVYLCNIFNIFINEKTLIVSDSGVDYFKNILKTKPDALLMSPFNMNLLIKMIEKNPLILNHLKLINLTGGLAKSDYVTKLCGWGIDVCNCYGMSEVNCFICYNNVKETKNYESIGKIIDNKFLQYRIVNGYLELKGHPVIEKYLNVANNLYFDGP